MHLRRIIATAVAPALAMAAAAGASVAFAAETDYLALSAGAFNVEDKDRVAEFRVEYRSKLEWWLFKPFTGIMATTDEALYGYAGVLVDLHLGGGFMLTPSFAAGAYSKEDGRDLGHVLEFRSQIEIAYRFAGQARLALSFSHLSNASISERNPGVQSAMLTYAIPFKRLLGR